jgi:hypothetical protein
MSINQSPNTVTNGLVFAYDMSNTKKSWKGEPVTNSFNCPNPYDANNNVSFLINGTGTFQRVYGGTYGGYTITPEDVVYRYNLGEGGCHYHGNSAAISAGQYVCYSVDYYISPDASDYVTNGTLVVLENYGGSALGGGTGVSSDVTTKGKWQTIQGYSGPTGGSGTQAMFLYPGGCSGAGSYIASRGFILMKNPMFEFRSNVKYNPFVNGTRSNTQALVDLTNNNTITATSLTYSSTGTFSFNGSSNTLDCGNASSLSALTGTSNVTVEAWVNLSGYGSTSGYGVITHKGFPWAFLMENPSNTMRIRFSLSSSGDVSCSDSATHALNTWYHFVGTYDGSNMRFYRNGILTNTVAGSGTIGGGGQNMIVGSYSGAYFSQGQIPNVKVYNRTLSAAEVQQNFNALRGRYGL